MKDEHVSVAALFNVHPSAFILHPLRMESRSPRMLRDAVAISLLCLCVYLLTVSGHLYSPDEETMYQVAASIATRGTVDIPVDQPLPLIALVQGNNGHWYAHFGILPSLLALPFFVLGRALGGGDTPVGTFLSHLLISLINAPISAIAAGVLAFWMRRLGYGRAAAWAVALIYAFATPAWVYSRTFFSEPLTALLLLLACERAYTYRQHGNRSAALLCGLWCGLMLATRVATGVLLPWVALYLVLSAEPRVGNRESNVSEKMRFPRFWFSVFDSWFSFALGLLPGLVLFAGYNLARGDALWSTGYGSESWIFTTPLSVSLPGLLWRPEHSLLFYAPPVLLGLLGLLAFWRRHRATVLLILACSISYTLLHAGRVAWEGGAAWGPRYLVPLVPLLVLPAAALLAPERRTEDGRRNKQFSFFIFRPLSLLAALCSVVGLLVTLLGLLVNFNTYPNDQEMRERGTLFGLQTAIGGHAWLLRERLALYRGGSRCALADGLYQAEAPPPSLLPRRTGSSGKIVCRANDLAAVSMLLDDRRPPNAPVGELTLLRNGTRVEGMRAGEQRLYTLLLPSGQSTLELHATTWNPKVVGFSERDDDLGVAIMDLQARALGGAPLPLVDTSIEPLSPNPIKRWAWYYQPTNMHLLDMWWWYLPRSEIGPTGALIFGTLLVLVAAGALVGAVMLLQRGTNRKGTKAQRTMLTAPAWKE